MGVREREGERGIGPAGLRLREARYRRGDRWMGVREREAERERERERERLRAGDRRGLHSQTQLNTSVSYTMSGS
jgi:hypothetical protein